MIEIIEKLNTVIRMQSSIINDLYKLLMQHISVDEAEKLDVTKRINLMADIMKGG